jgi:hypothetical protein
MSFGISIEELTWDVVSKVKKDDDSGVKCRRQPWCKCRALLDR